MNDKLTAAQALHISRFGSPVEWAMRRDFERRCLDHFNAKRAAGVKIIDDNGSPATPEALFWENPDGSYGVAAFNVAWIAYRWGFEAAKAALPKAMTNDEIRAIGDEYAMGCGPSDLKCAVREVEKRYGTQPQSCDKCRAQWPHFCTVDAEYGCGLKKETP